MRLVRCKALPFDAVCRRFMFAGMPQSKDLPGEAVYLATFPHISTMSSAAVQLLRSSSPDITAGF